MAVRVPRVTFSGHVDIDRLFQDLSGNNYLSVTSASFTASTVLGATGADTLLVTSTNAVSNSTLQGADGDDKLKVTSDLNDSTLAGGVGNDSLHLAGGAARSSIFGGKGNDTITLVVGDQQVDGALIQSTSGNNTTTVTSNTVTKNLTVVGGSGVDKFSLAGEMENFVFKGAVGNDSVLLDKVTNSTIYGGTGDDTVGDGALRCSDPELTGTNTIDIDGNTDIHCGGDGKDTFSTPEPSMVVPWVLELTPSI